MAQNVEDCALLQEVISTYDTKDSTSIDFKLCSRAPRISIFFNSVMIMP